MEQRTASCPSCGRGNFPEDAFCSWCGARLGTPDERTGESRRSLARRTIPTGERATCGSCNSPILPGDLFCSTCGARSGSDVVDAGFGDSWTSIPTRVTEASGGKYEFIRELGRGGMGIVFMARDQELQRPVAIKVLSPSWLTDEAMVQRFEREARTIASLRHESIVSVYDVGRSGDLHYFVMDFIEGVSLSKILRVQGPLSIPVVEIVLYRVGLALSYAHRPGRGIIHRDIKPSNIMLDSEGQATVMDFGISKVSETPSGLTRTGLVMGTPEYMSPEQCRGHTVTHESDQYSLGCVVYAMLTGAPPFTGPFYRVLMAHQTEPVPPVLDVRPDCPPELAAATERMLAKLPGDRWPDIRDAVKALGLRPPAPDDPVIDEIGRLVRTTVEKTRSAEGADGGQTRRTPTSMRIVPQPEDLEVGDEVSLVANMLFPDGAEEPGRDVTWESTDPAIARVDPSTGELVAVAPGSALISAAGVGLKEMVQVEVKPPQVVQIAIEPGVVEVEVGSSTRLTAHPRSKRGVVLERPVSWSCSDPRTASVSADGVVTAKRSGTVSVIANCDGVGSASMVRVVGEGTISQSASLASPPAAGTSGGWTGGQPEAGVAPSSDAALPDSPGTPADRIYGDRRPSPSRASRGRPVRPSRGATPARQEEGRAGAARARLPLSRLLTLGVPVAAVVIAAGFFWLMSRHPESVRTPTVAALGVLKAGGGAIPGDTLGLDLGDTVSLEASASDAAGDPLQEAVSWRSSDPSVASVDAAGMLVGLADGVARISATAGGVSHEVAVSVHAVPVDVVVHARGESEPVSTLHLLVGQGLALQAVPEDRTGHAVTDAPVSWRTSSAGVASVDENGMVGARAAGRAVLSATVGAVTHRIAVTVSAPRPATPPQPSPTEYRQAAPAQPRQAAPAKGTLVLRFLPSWANVFIDGVSHGEHTGGLDLSIAPGRHTLRLQNPNLAQLDTVFVVQPGGRVELRLRMRSR